MRFELKYFRDKVDNLLIKDGYFILLSKAVPPSNLYSLTHLAIDLSLVEEDLARTFHALFHIISQLLHGVCVGLSVLANYR
jgi:hypothetical protein